MFTNECTTVVRCWQGGVDCSEKLIQDNKSVDESMVSGLVAVANSTAFGAAIEASRDRENARDDCDSSDEGWDD